MRSPRRPNRPTLLLEQLEDRLLLAGNLIATTEVPGRIDYNLMVYTQQGTQVSSQNIPPVPAANEYQDARGLTVDPSGNVNILDGTLSPALATLSTATQTWSFHTTPGWGVGSNISYGEVAAYKNFVFASNMQSLNGVFNGIVRFDSLGSSPVLFAPGTQSLQITLGLDGQIYELVGNGNSPAPNPTINVFNPDTLALVRTFHLSTAFTSDIRSIAVDASGNVYAADWNGTVTKYDPSGNPTGASILLKDTNGFGENLMNVAIDTDGQIAVGGRDGGIFLTDESLASAKRIPTGQWNVFVTFDHYIGGASQTVTPSFSSLAGPTISYGQPTATLGGTISAGATYPPGSVNITVNGVTKSAAISSTDGTFSAAFDTSALGVSGSPYTITYSYAAQGNYAGTTDTSKALTVTPAVTTLGALAGPTISYGQSSVTLGGTISAGSLIPTGNVSITVNGVTKSANINSSDGTFSAVFDTSALGVSGSPYTITYSYAAQGNYAGTTDTSKSLTVTPAVTTLGSLAGPTISYGQPTATLGGTISAGATYPPGSVNITVNGVTKSAAISSTDGTFSAAFDTSSLGVSGSPYTITYSYAAQGNYTGTTDNSKSLTVTPAVTTLGALAGPTISYGQSSVTLGGTISAGSLIPTGNVSITVNGVTKSANINSSDGTFSAVFDTSSLGVSSSPYTITYSYAAQGNYAGITDTSKSLTVSPVVTPSFSSLAGPTITYGQPTVTLGGTISAGSLVPTGSVNITVNGVTKSAAINPTDGTFSAVFDTSSLGVSGSPYTITYSYAAQGNYNAITDTSKSLTVTPAVTTLTKLSSPTVVIGTAKATLSGVVGSNSVLPVGQSVTVKVVGANGPVASGSGKIDSNGYFSVTIKTSSLPVGAYTIQYAYAGDANFKPSQGKGTLTVTYAVNPVFDNTKPVHAGAALPIKLQVTDASGNDLSSANLTVTAVALVDANGNTITPSAKGNANPGNVFRHTGFGYLYNLDTAGLTAGTYTLLVRVGNDPVLHAISFVVD